MDCISTSLPSSSSPTFQTFSKSKAVADFIFRNDSKPSLDSLKSLKDQVLTIDGQKYFFAAVSPKLVNYRGDKFAVVDVQLTMASDTNIGSVDQSIARTQIILLCDPSNGDHQLAPISAQTPVAEIRQEMALTGYLPDDYSSEGELIAYTGKSFQHLNKHLRENTVIKDVQALQEFHRDMFFTTTFNNFKEKVLNASDHSESFIENMYGVYRQNLAVDSAYENYLQNLRGRPNSDATLKSGKYYFSTIVGITQKNFMCKKFQVKFDTVYRGLGKKDLHLLFPSNTKNIDGIPIVQVGDQVIDKAFISTSLCMQQSINEFALKDSIDLQKRPESEGVLIEITPDVKNPPLALGLEKISKWAEEKEVLFPPNSIFTVTKVDISQPLMKIVGTISRPAHYSSNV